MEYVFYLNTMQTFKIFLNFLGIAADMAEKDTAVLCFQKQKHLHSAFPTHLIQLSGSLLGHCRA